ncbi:exodeoxyribonuclease I [Hydromonas duriensis]|uniref:Exodeoxyribonuclease I n=1 Tax=Hydromonas duriensis TaxID=1527608 RepID=A0A4R6Y8H9_9BURK|nr:exodeoxyribonuclease I [Hydromonas duriensis]TDR31715.1 exodeoxyribonuclease I subunit C [Hydromonas duriensis]
MSYTFFWHDYETFGAVPRRDRPAQFAGIRTDSELNEIGSPVEVFCRPSPDYVPEPQACLITHITPQQCLEDGVSEQEFAQVVERELGATGTVGVGYNSIRFDDEVTRHLFWRNLIDPYAREWQNQCGRWDILDVVRTAYALRPKGIQWPMGTDGKVSFRLELLTQANGIAHEAAHDAVSDVRATIALARLIRDKQPKLFEFCFALHKKDRVLDEIGRVGAMGKPFLHISGMYPVERGCLSVVWPLAIHPTNKNEIIVWDLAHDPRELLSLSVDDIKARMFTRTDDLAEGVTRLPIKTIHINKSPIVIGNLKTLSAEMADKWSIDMEQIQAHAQRAAELPDMSQTWHGVYQREFDEALDVEQDLYGGFVGNGDRRVLNDLRGLDAQSIARAKPSFVDARLEELFWRYRARNFPHTLNAQEQNLWRQQCAQRVLHGAAGGLTAHAALAQIDDLAIHADEEGQMVLGDLYEYISELQAYLS